MNTQGHDLNVYGFPNNFHFLTTHFIKYYKIRSTHGNTEMIKIQAYTMVFLKGLEERLAVTSTEDRHQFVQSINIAN